jgi:group I intron endonuclease
MLGYKHNLEAINKMKLRFKDKTKHPMYGKTYDIFALNKISKPGRLNPMFNKKHKIESIQKMSLSKSKIPLGLYDIKNNLINKFINQVELAKYLNLHKSNIGRYLKTGKLILNKYYIRKINKQ